MASRRLFDGAQIELGILPIVGPVAAGVTADLSATLAALTLSSDATVASAGVTADLSATLAALSLAADATITQPTITGDLSVTLEDATLAAAAFFGPQAETVTGGAYGKPRKARQREFIDERKEREELRLLVERAVDPIRAKSAQVVQTESEDGEQGIAIVTRTRQTAVPVPASFDVAEVARMVSAALERAGIEARRVASEQAQRKAVAALEAAIKERQYRILKRRREEEILLLM
jgi:hypothetical protein